MEEYLKAQNFRSLTTPLAAIAAVALVGIFGSPLVQAQTSDDAPRITQGLAIAPVPLKLTNLDTNLVGLGSYIVNAIAVCNDCHNTPQAQFVAGANPYFGQGKKINPANYLGGGRDFGALVDGTAHIVSRNLTP